MSIEILDKLLKTLTNSMLKDKTKHFNIILTKTKTTITTLKIENASANVGINEF